MERGVLVLGNDGVSFRHELARRAVEAALSPMARQRLNRMVLGALRERDVDPARLAHHASEANDDDALLELALPAARHASRSGAHREALALYERALPLFEGLPAAERAQALEELRFEAYVGARIMAALEAQERALDLWRELGDERRIGEALRWLALLSAAVARSEDAAAFADEAIAVLQALPPGCELAAAYSTRSRLYLLAHRNDAAVEWGLKAVALARKCEDWETVAETQVNVGSALVPQDAEEGIAVLTEAAANAEERGFPVIASRARMNSPGATRPPATSTAPTPC